MRIRRDHQRLLHARRLAAAIVPVAIGLVVAGVSLTPASARAVPMAGRLAAVDASSSLLATTAGRPVAPRIRSVPIPAFSSVGRAVPRDLAAALRSAGTGKLVAVTKRPVLSPFSMVAVTWDSMPHGVGPSIRLRTRHAGAWSGWTKLGVDGDGPSAAEDASVRAGTTPYWVGRATGVEVAVYARGAGRPAHLSVDTIDPGTSVDDSRIAVTPRTESAKRTTTGSAGSFPRKPDIVTRAQWGADESLGSTCWDPKYGTRFDAVIVHHTAGTNDYTRRESAAVVRGVLAYHTVSRGWCDIGYNFLVDRYGTIYEGRAGGIRQPVRGAHAGDYNVDTTGISMMGNFDIASAPRAMKRSLVQLVAWRLGTAYHGAYGHPYLYDGRFDRIAGHRDVMSTACPGRYAYAWLPSLRHRVAARLNGFESKIEAAWKAAGGRHGRLGPVREGERLQAGGHNTRFDGGRMYYSRYGVYTLYPGPVLHYYAGAGGVRGELGYPESGVHTTAGSGKTAKFAYGRVYWSSASNSHGLRHGAILRAYLRAGAAGGRLGFPTSGVHAVSGGQRAGFQAGYITYDRSTGKTTVTTR